MGEDQLKKLNKNRWERAYYLSTCDPALLCEIGGGVTRWAAWACCTVYDNCAIPLAISANDEANLHHWHHDHSLARIGAESIWRPGPVVLDGRAQGSPRAVVEDWGHEDQRGFKVIKWVRMFFKRQTHGMFSYYFQRYTYVLRQTYSCILIDVLHAGLTSISLSLAKNTL